MGAEGRKGRLGLTWAGGRQTISRLGLTWAGVRQTILANLVVLGPSYVHMPSVTSLMPQNSERSSTADLGANRFSCDVHHSARMVLPRPGSSFGSRGRTESACDLMLQRKARWPAKPKKSGPCCSTQPLRLCGCCAAQLLCSGSGSSGGANEAVTHFVVLSALSGKIFSLKISKFSGSPSSTALIVVAVISKFSGSPSSTALIVVAVFRFPELYGVNSRGCS